MKWNCFEMSIIISIKLFHFTGPVFLFRFQDNELVQVKSNPTIVDRLRYLSHYSKIWNVNL